MHKKLLAVLLCAAVLVSLFAGLTVSASATDTCTRTEMEKAIAETAIAYYLKGPDGQYDSFPLSGRGRTRSQIFRLTFGMSPETLSPQRRFYTVCSSYPHEVYYDALGTHPLTAEQMANTDLSGNSRTAERTGLPLENLTDKDLEYAMSLISLTANYGAYGKKVANNEDGWVGKGGVVFYWGSNNYENVTDADLAYIKSQLRPGDIISVVRGDEEDDDGENSGHTMVFLGDYKGDGELYLIHSTGNKYNNNDTSYAGSTYTGNNSGALRAGTWTDDGTASGNSIVGFDRVESASIRCRNGTIAINPYDYTLGRGKMYGPGYANSSLVIKQFVVTRPIDMIIGWEGNPEDVSDDDLFPRSALTTNALARSVYPGLEISTVADKSYYNDVQAGEELTYSFIVENDTNLSTMTPRYGAYGRSYSNLSLTVTLPENASYVGTAISDTASPSVPGTTTYDEGSRTLTVAGFKSTAGKTFRVNVTVRISAGAQPGDKVTMPGGRVDGPNTDGFFRVAGLTHTVGGAHPTGFDGINASSVVPSGARTKMDVANDVYAAAGYKLDLPDTNTFLNSVLTYTFQAAETSRRMQSRLLEPGEITDPDTLLLRKMIVPEYIGGKKLFTTTAAGTRTNENRLRDFREDFLQPGDILVYAYTGAASEVIGRGFGSEANPEQVYVYLGDSRYAYYDEEGAFRVISAPVRTFLYSGDTPKGETTTFDRDGSTSSSFSRVEWSAVLTQAFRFSYFFCLRPSLAYTDINTQCAMTPSVSAAYTVTTSGGATTGYSSLASALSAANASSGSTLTLREDAALTAGQVFYGGTLDLNGHTLTTGAYSLTLGSGSSAQTLKNGTVVGTGDAVVCADSSATTIKNMRILGGKTGAALAASDTASVTLDGAELASAKQDALPVYTPSGTQTNWTFANDVTVLVPSSLSDYAGNGAAPGTDVTRYLSAINGYFKISDADDLSPYRAVTFTKDPTVYNETKGISYASFSDALQGAGANDTLVFRRDVSTANFRETGNSVNYGRGTSGDNKKYALYVGKSLTIDFDGYTFLGEGGTVGTTASFFLSGTIYVTMKNGTIRTKNGWAVNQLAKEFRLENMKLYTHGPSVILSDSSRVARTLIADKGTVIVGGLKGSSSPNSNVAIELRHGNVIVRGGSRIGSLTGIAIRPNAVNGTAENPNTSNVTVEDGTLFTGRYAYTHGDSAYGYYDTGYDATKNNATLSFLADTDTEHYLREQHKEEVLDLPGSKTIIAVDRTTKRPGPVQNTTTGAQYDTLAEAFAEAASGQTITLNRALTMSENATLPAGVTLDLGEHTLTVPAGVTLDASAGAMTAEAAGGMDVAGTVAYSATPANRIPDGQVQMEAGGAYGNVTAPASAELAGQTVVPEPGMEKSLSLNLNDTVLINHYLADSGSVYTDESFAFVDGERVSMTKEGTNWYLPVRESVAKEMGRESTVQPVGVDSAGKYHLGKSSTLSIRWYAEQMIGTTDWSADNGAKLGRAMIGMLNYGAAAQNYFNYQTDDLANRNLTETEQARMTVYTAAKLAEYRVNSRQTNDPESVYVASSCVLGSSQALRFYLNLPESRADRESLVFRVNYRNYNGAGRTVTKSFAELVESTTPGVYYFEVSGMAAADVKTDVTLTVEKAGSAIATVTDSILSYCARVHDGNPSATALVNLTDAVLIYGLSARDYFYRPNAQPDAMENELPMN